MLENGSTTELIRQKKASLFLRLAVSKDKDGILKLAKQGQICTSVTSKTKKTPKAITHPLASCWQKKKDDLLVKYAMHNISSQLFVSKYQLYLPDKQTLQEQLSALLQNTK